MTRPTVPLIGQCSVRCVPWLWTQGAELVVSGGRSIWMIKVKVPQFKNTSSKNPAVGFYFESLF